MHDPQRLLKAANVDVALDPVNERLTITLPIGEGMKLLEAAAIMLPEDSITYAISRAVLRVVS